MTSQLHQLAHDIEATTDEMIAACEAFKAEVMARRDRAQRYGPDCSKAEWTLLRRLDRLWARRRCAMREQRELLERLDVPAPATGDVREVHAVEADALVHAAERHAPAEAVAA